MTDLYSVLGISKQAHYRSVKRAIAMMELSDVILNECNRIRKNHKVMGCVKIHGQIGKTIGLGRDRFLEHCKELGLFVKRKRCPHRTTHSSKFRRFPNLSDGLVLTGPNQLWQSDIFYIHDMDKHRYGFTIIDVYTRELLALRFATDMRAQNLEKAIKEAVKRRAGQNLSGCVFHSDGGRQYEDLSVMSYLKSMGMQQSMCIRAQQNAYAERVQGTMKYEYLFLDDSSRSMKQKFYRAMQLYNNSRPHDELGGLTPTEFQQLTNKTPINERPEMQVYQWIEPILTFTTEINKRKKNQKRKQQQLHLINN